ncbi:hypothetical protein F5Y13DRAFT_197073 [Hypoxylon sp. FL1857]|nr:hypothetical protein F5Y13DRAFT_197073 [Hypoxylon sp. FL1857]
MASEPFKFLVGPNRKEYFIHKEAFIAISPVLRVLITGRMREAREGVAVWEDVEECHFLNLCEFAYFGKYTAPRMKDAPLTTPLPYRPEGEAENVYGDHGRKTLLVLDNFARRFFDKYKSPRGDSIEYKRNGIGWRDGTEYFLRHANMYILGDRYDVETLRAEALFHIAKGLANTHDTWDNIPAFAKLARLTYSNTREHDQLRELLSKYVSLRGDDLFLHPDIESLRNEYPDFESDIMGPIMELHRQESERLKNREKRFKRKVPENEDHPEEPSTKRPTRRSTRRAAKR